MTTTPGYLAGFKPHILNHIPYEYWEAVHEIVKPQPMSEAAAVSGYSPHTLSNHMRKRILDRLNIDDGTGWRVALTRLYYGIDRCWCQK